MFRTLVDYFSKYQNSYIKHDDAVIVAKVEFVFRADVFFHEALHPAVEGCNAMILSKDEVAQRQIEVAIRMYFQHGDEVRARVRPDRSDCQSHWGRSIGYRRAVARQWPAHGRLRVRDGQL